MNAKLNPILTALLATTFFAGSAQAAEPADVRAQTVSAVAFDAAAETDGSAYAQNVSRVEQSDARADVRAETNSAVTLDATAETAQSTEAQSVSRVEQDDTQQRSDARAEQNATTDANASSYSQARAEQADTIDNRVSGDTQQRAESRDNNFENAAALALRAQLDQAGKLAQPGAIAGSPVSMPDFNPSYAMPSGAITGGAAMSASAPSTGGPAMNTTPSFSGSAAVSGSVNFGR